jgi:hypothetical protein
MNEALRRRWRRPPFSEQLWRAAEDDLVRALPPAEAARRTGRSLKAVYQRRRVLGLADRRAKGRA